MPDQPTPIPIGSSAFWRLPTVLAETGLSKTEIYRRIKQGRFPRARKVSSRVAVWPSSDIAAWQRQVAGETLAALLG